MPRGLVLQPTPALGEEAARSILRPKKVSRLAPAQREMKTIIAGRKEMGKGAHGRTTSWVRWARVK